MYAEGVKTMKDSGGKHSTFRRREAPDLRKSLPAADFIFTPERTKVRKPVVASRRPETMQQKQKQLKRSRLSRSRPGVAEDALAEVEAKLLELDAQSQKSFR